MIRSVLIALASMLVLLGGCADTSDSPLAPRATAPELSLSASDLEGVLEFATTPDLTRNRHAERYIRASEGGTVELNGFRVTIPAGALPADTLVTIDLPTDDVLGRRVMAEFGPHAVRFNQPVTISFPLEGVQVPAGSIHVARWENGAWTPLGGSHSADGRSFFSTTPHFSRYVLAGG